MGEGLIDRGHGDDADMRRFTVDGLVAAVFLRPSHSIRCSRACD